MVAGRVTIFWLSWDGCLRTEGMVLERGRGALKVKGGVLHGSGGRFVGGLSWEIQGLRLGGC